LVLVDTDVLIWYLRGNLKAKKVIDALGPFSVSSINYMELVQGARNRHDLIMLRRFVRARDIEVLHVNEEISQKALFYTESFSLSHNLRTADALIAATASAMGADLLTGNARHYDPIKEIHVKKFLP
jgi:predicted nucleic acid-binding protein